MEHSITLATTAIGGVLLRTIQQMPGTATSTITMAISTGTITISKLVFLCVASGI
jgi:hypothetical protein